MEKVIIDSSKVEIRHRGFTFSLEQVMDIVEKHDEYITHCDFDRKSEEITGACENIIDDAINEIKEHIDDHDERLKAIEARAENDFK